MHLLVFVYVAAANYGSSKLGLSIDESIAPCEKVTISLDGGFYCTFHRNSPYIYLEVSGATSPGA